VKSNDVHPLMILIVFGALGYVTLAAYQSFKRFVYSGNIQSEEPADAFPLVGRQTGWYWAAEIDAVAFRRIIDIVA
jgi:hypothetical protein